MPDDDVDAVAFRQRPPVDLVVCHVGERTRQPVPRLLIQLDDDLRRLVDHRRASFFTGSTAGCIAPIVTSASSARATGDPSHCTSTHPCSSNVFTYALPDRSSACQMSMPVAVP